MAQNHALVLTRVFLEGLLLAVVVDLLTGVRDQLARKLRHYVVALAQSLSGDLHARVTDGVGTVVVGDRFLVVAEWGAIQFVSKQSTPVTHIEKIVASFLTWVEPKITRQVAAASTSQRHARMDLVHVATSAQLVHLR